MKVRMLVFHFMFSLGAVEEASAVYITLFLLDALGGCYRRHLNQV